MTGPRGLAEYAGEPPEGSRPLSQFLAKFIHNAFALPTHKKVDRRQGRSEGGFQGVAEPPFGIIATQRSGPIDQGC